MDEPGEGRSTVFFPIESTACDEEVCNVELLVTVAAIGAVTHDVTEGVTTEALDIETVSALTSIAFDKEASAAGNMPSWNAGEHAAEDFLVNFESASDVNAAADLSDEVATLDLTWAEPSVVHAGL